MKKIILTIGLLMAIVALSQAQNLNWRTLEDKKHVASLNLGIEYGNAVQLGYFRKLGTKKPLLLGGDVALPFGEDMFDDIKVRWGGQMELFESKGFSVSGRVMANYRKTVNQLVRVASFGTEFGLVTGYYREGWHVAGEVGFDKAVATNLKHTDIYRDNVYSGVQDGWYVPTAGNWFYGIQGSKQVGQSTELTARFGITSAQGEDQNGTLPKYFQLGIIKKF